jgi:hypothetical protein
MAQGATRYADISALLPDIWEAALEYARHETIMMNLVTNFRDRSGLVPRKNSEYAALTAKPVGEDDDLTPDKYTRSLLSTLTPAEIGLQVFLTDSEIESDDASVRANAGRELGAALAEKVETDLLGNFSSLTGGTIGTAGSAMSWGYFFAARSVLRNTRARPPYMCVMHDYQWHVLAKAASIASTTVRSDAPSWVDAVMRRWYLGQVANVAIFSSNLISVDTSDDAYAAMFPRQALALDLRRPFRLEPERDASRRGWELNATMVYAHGTWEPAKGVQMILDATTPTGV